MNSTSTRQSKTTVKQKIDFFEGLGYKVHVKHYRYYDEPYKSTLKIFDGNDFLSATGGHTEVIIKDGDEVVYTDTAHCCSEDNYNKKIGANIALGRIIQRLMRG